MDEDYAVIVLTQRLGDRFGFFGTKRYDASWDDDAVWDTIGYASDVAQSNFPIFQLNVSLDEDELDLGSGRAMTTSADAMPIGLADVRTLDRGSGRLCRRRHVGAGWRRQLVRRRLGSQRHRATRANTGPLGPLRSA